jgi:hypothetical protein
MINCERVCFTCSFLVLTYYKNNSKFLYAGQVSSEPPARCKTDLGAKKESGSDLNLEFLLNLGPNPGYAEFGSRLRFLWTNIYNIKVIF